MRTLLLMLALASATYHGDVVISPDAGTLQASWSVTFVADSASRDSVTLLLNAGFRDVKVRGNDVASVRDSIVSKDEQRIIVRLKSVRVGEKVKLAISYAGAPVFGSDGINRINSNWVELGLDSYWHPVFAGYTYRITGDWKVKLPKGWDAVASGATSHKDGTLFIKNTTPLVDLAFSAAPSLRHGDGAAASVYHVNADSATVARVLRTADGCGSYLNARYGARGALPHAKIVIAPRQGPGYARKNYIVITDAAQQNDVALARFVCHEFAHFWSSGAISSGPENWLNEAFAEFASGRYVRDAMNADEYAKVVAQWAESKDDQAPVWTPELTKRPGARTAYRKAPYLLDQLEQRIGKEKMEQLLARYMTQRVATTKQLLAMLADVASQDASRWFREALAR